MVLHNFVVCYCLLAFLQILATVFTKRSLPGTKTLQDLREKQKKEVQNIGQKEIFAKALIKRLRKCNPNGGIENFDIFILLPSPSNVLIWFF